MENELMETVGEEIEDEGKSEFGKGLITCLIKFSEHTHNFTMDRISFYKQFSEKTKKEQELILFDNPPDRLNYGRQHMKNIKFFVSKMVPIFGSFEKAMSQEIVLWFNASSDHLYEIEVPEGKKWDNVRKKVKELQEKGLEIGHGFPNRVVDWDEVIYLIKLVKEIILDIDKTIGLEPDWGKW